MKKCRKFISLFITAILLMTAVFGNAAYASPLTTDFIKSTAEETEWDVYIYLCGSDLESVYKNATNNLNSLLKAEYSEDVRFIIQTGGAKEWQNDWINPDKLQRFVIQGSNKTLVWEDELESMGYPDTLSDFIKWGKKYYPSKRSMFVVWDHGDSYCGAVIDDQYDREQLSIPDFEKAFTDAGAHFDILDFDCCMMADLDVCLNMSSFADYLIVSEEVMDGWGQDYRAIGNYLAFNPGCNGKTLGKIVCGSYIDSLHDHGITDTNGLSLIDTSQLPAVREAFLGMIRAMTERMSDTEVFSEILRAAYRSKSYSYAEEKDLVSFAKSIAPYVDEAVCLSVEDAVRKAVAAKAQTTESTYNNGISFYWAPSTISSYVKTYSNVTDMNEYLAFIDAIIWNVNLPSRIYENTERLKQLDYDTYAIRYEMQDNKGVFDTLKITGGEAALNSIYYSIYGTYNDRLIEISKLGNISFDKSGTKFKTEFDGRIVAINGEPLVLNVVSETPEYILYDAPVYIVKDEETVLRNLRVAFVPDKADDETDFIGSLTDEEHGSFTIIGLANETSTSAANSMSKDSTLIKDGMVLYPAYPTADGNTNIMGNPVVYDNNTAVATKQLDDGTYYLNYEIGSSLGKKLITNDEEFRIVEGKITATKAGAETPDGNSSGESFQEDMLNNYGSGEYHINTVKARTESKEEPAKVTLMVYMTDSNYESIKGIFTEEIEDFMQAEDSDKVNVILQTGGGFGWKGDCFDADSIQRFEIHHNVLTEVYKEPEYNMSTEAALEDYIRWCAENYPAEHYIIEFFDHGAAWGGMCIDEKYGSILTLDDISTAMKNSGIHFDMTYFNMCLMSTIEVAAAIKPYSDYMLAPEGSIMAVIYSEGDMVNYIIRHADDFDAAELGKHKAETFISDIERFGKEQEFQTMSVIDLSKIPAVLDAVDQMGREMSEIAKDPAKLTRLIRGLNSSRKFGYDFMRDIVDLARHADGVSTATKNVVANAVNDGVYYMTATKDYIKNGGITINFDIKSDLQNYSMVCPVKDYLAFLDCVNIGYHVLPKVMSDDRRVKSVSPLDFRVKNSLKITEDDNVSLVVESNPEIINDVSYRVMEYDADQNKYYYMYYGTDIDLDEKEGKLTANFDGRTTALGGKYCYMEKYQVLDDKILFDIPVKCEDRQLSIRVAYYAPESLDGKATDSEINKEAGKKSGYSFLDDRIDFDNGKFEIIGLFEDEDYKGYLDDPYYSLSSDMELTLQIPEVDSNGQLLGYVDGDTFFWDKDMNISLKSLPDGDYVLGYVIINGMLKNTFSDTADISIKNDRIKTVGLTNTGKIRK